MLAFWALTREKRMGGEDSNLIKIVELRQLVELRCYKWGFGRLGHNVHEVHEWKRGKGTGDGGSLL